MKRRTSFVAAGLVFGALAGLGARVYQRRTRERVSGWEGLDAPDVAAAFNWVSRFPQFALMRWLIARRAAAMQSEGQAADLGCGPGYLALELAHQAPGLRVVGIDLSDEMLAEAEAQALWRGADDRISFMKGDVRRIPLPDGSLDLIVSTLSLHHWGNPVEVLDEIDRVLRPGGSFLIADLRRDLAPPFYLLIWFATRVVVPRALKRVNEPLGSRDSAYTPEEAAALARRSRLTGWRITRGPMWLIIEGHKR
jgi:ubiquinone/menaquinone biosynthesis C-methylase UbiE